MNSICSHVSKGARAVILLGLPVRHRAEGDSIKGEPSKVLRRGQNSTRTETACTLEFEGVLCTTPYRSHFKMSCEAISYMSSNISRMAAVPNAGMRIRSAHSQGEASFSSAVSRRASLRANSQFSSPGFALDDASVNGAPYLVSKRHARTVNRPSPTPFLTCSKEPPGFLMKRLSSHASFMSSYELTTRSDRAVHPIWS